MDEFEILYRHRPRTTPPNPLVRDLARRNLADLMAGGVESGQAPGSILRGRWGVAVRRPLIVVLALVAVVSVIVLGPNSEPGGVGGISAAEALEQISRVATQQEGPWIDGDYDGYLHFQRESATLISDAGYSWISKTSSEEWIAADGSGRISAAFSGAEFPSEEDRLAWMARFGSTGPDLPPLKHDFGPGQMREFSERLPPAGLPADPDALEEVLREHVSQTGVGSDPSGSESDHMVRTIADWLQMGLLPPAHRAALYEVLARLPGVEALGPTADRAGRVGEGFAAEIQDGDFRIALIIDPNTSELLGTETFQLRRLSVPSGLHPEDAERIAAQFRYQPSDLPASTNWSFYQSPQLVDTLPGE